MLEPPDATAAEVERARVPLGLDRPIVAQYWLYLTGLFQGDLGRSFVHDQPTIDLVLQRLPATVEPGVTAFVMSLIIRLPLGLVAGCRAGRLAGDGIMNGSIFACSPPNFWPEGCLTRGGTERWTWRPPSRRRGGEPGCA